MANERTAAMDALIADSADMIDAPASADAMGDVERVARIIEPGAWLIYDMAAQCYIEGRGSRGDENYFYERTYKAGCRTLDDYRRWWETCSHSCLEETIFRWRDSSVKATAALSAMSPAGEVERAVLVERERCALLCEAMEHDQDERAYDKRRAGRIETQNCAKATAARQLAHAIREPKP